ncbi:MAG: hypothetical protein HY303_18380, partial [Candidatus Wallbacteria bacterium]|nr:hypothetical protein [Candidatus Wallbacteria bacterium]
TNFLVENNELTDTTSLGINIVDCPSAFVNKNSLHQVSAQMNTGIQLRNSGPQVTQNRVLGSSGLEAGIVVVDCVSGADVSTRLALDHNTVTKASFGAVLVFSSDPVVRFNELANGFVGVVVEGLDTILPKEPLIFGNNIRGNQSFAVGRQPVGVAAATSSGGGILGSALAGGANFISGNNGEPGADLTVQGTVDQRFDVSTPQIDSVDAILSSTGTAVAGAGAP